jgi:hypothetical protein
MEYAAERPRGLAITAWSVRLPSCNRGSRASGAGQTWPQAVELFRRRLVYFISDSPYKIYFISDSPYKIYKAASERLQTARGWPGQLVAGAELAALARGVVEPEGACGRAYYFLYGESRMDCTKRRLNDSTARG